MPHQPSLLIVSVVVALVSFLSCIPTTPFVAASRTWILPRRSAANKHELRAVAVGQNVHIVDASHQRRHTDFLALSFASIDELRSEINAIRWSPNGEYLAAVSDNGNVLIMNGTTGSVIKKINASPEPIYAVDFSADSNTVVTAGEDQMIRAFSPPSTMQRAPGNKNMRGHRSRIRALAAHPTNSTLFASGANDPSEVWLWDLDSVARADDMEAILPVHKMAGHKKPLRAVEFVAAEEEAGDKKNKKNVEILSVGYSGELWSHDAVTGQVSSTRGEPIKIHKGVPVTGIAVQRLPPARLRFRDPRTGQEPPFQPLVATGGYDGLVYLFQHVAYGVRSIVIPTIARKQLEEAPVASLSFSMDGRILAVSTSGPTKTAAKKSCIHFISLDTMKRVGPAAWCPHGEESGTVVAAFSPTSQTTIATASQDGMVRLFDITFGEVVEKDVSNEDQTGTNGDTAAPLRSDRFNIDKAEPFLSVAGNGLETVSEVIVGEDGKVTVRGNRGTALDGVVHKRRKALEQPAYFGHETKPGADL